MPASILIVDDEEGIRESLGALLRDEGYEVTAVASGEECLEQIEAREFDLVLLDVWLKEIDGLETLSRIQGRDTAPMVVMISGHGNIETAVRATKLGAFDFIEKPLSLGKIILVVRNALDYVRLEEENRRLRAELEERHEILGNSVPMKALRQQIALTAPTNGRVLIYGESGTGKELVARALHGSSARRSMPFVEVNCAAIPEELIESEMFGHRKGSFTGASEDKAGKFQKADGGTLFLDEIGDMSMKTQSKVLRVLEEQRVEPIGSNQAVSVDVRVLAATNKKLEEEIERNAFREDLFYRLNVIPFYVPALRERTEDIPILAAHFLNEFCAEYGKKPKEFSPAAMDVLLSYPWPGNVRELKNLVERLVIMCPSPKIEPHHLPPELFRGAAKSPLKPYDSLQEARSAYEREFVLRKLEENRWNMTKAAEALGLERSHLYRKMRALGIAPSKVS
ncbi:MAG TPA: sigma-54 dependent transcriptional regulator [Candidatus Acidoferrales bacterium]|jgi:two-component system nitrogen regulation response regulator NtrX|nr:sigma-54 dependent transcriptional regulator [Candidatus Acidoferrales bacterium]